MQLSREIAGENGEILELRIGGENVTAHRQMKTHREAFISAGEEKNIQNQLEPTSFFPSRRITRSAIEQFFKVLVCVLVVQKQRHHFM